MLETLHFVLFPIIWAMLQILRLLAWASGSQGLAIVGLSLVVAAVSRPIVRIGERHERRARETLLAMEPRLAEARRTLKGEQRFRATEKIYADHGWHPIKSALTATGFLISVPLLISSMILLLDHPPLRGQPFLFVPDLSRPDGLLALPGVAVNLLPIAMAGVSALDAWLKPGMDRATRTKFYLISAVLLALTYGLPSAVILYWLCNNLWALALTLVRRHRA